uniref:Uncharacterized protein n=1 Tax=Anguilla anguilla TaxID=7936 RepID=A0A0E9Q1H0_ANGAN
MTSTQLVNEQDTALLKPGILKWIQFNQMYRLHACATFKHLIKLCLVQFLFTQHLLKNITISGPGSSVNSGN